jgi:hypothetical protein
VTFRSGRNQVEECVRARLGAGRVSEMLEDHPDFSKPASTNNRQPVIIILDTGEELLVK